MLYREIIAVCSGLRTGDIKTLCGQEIEFLSVKPDGGSKQWRSWSRHTATSRKAAGSITDGVIGIFHWHNPLDRTVTIGWTKILTEMSTRNIYLAVKAVSA